VGRGARIVDDRHWDGLPTGAGRRVTTGDSPPSPRREPSPGPEAGPLQALLNRAAAARVEVGRRPLSVYDELTGTRIRTTAGKLGLPDLADALNQYIQRADEAKRGYLDFLDLVLSEELAVKDDRRFRQGLRLSKLPHHKTLDDYDFSFQPELDPRKVKDFASLSFVEEKANVALLGAPGPVDLSERVQLREQHSVKAVPDSGLAPAAESPPAGDT